MRTHSAMFIHAAMATVVATVPAAMAAAQAPTTYRSLRDARSEPLDELDRPRYRERTSGVGWEVRTDHFVVVSTAGMEEARWTAAEMERAWSDIGDLADYWTGAHRRDNFAIGAVGVLLSDRPWRYDRSPGPRPTNHSPDLYINVAADAPPLDEQLPSIRREAWRAFARVSGIEPHLPRWVERGWGQYFATSAAEHAASEPRVPTGGQQRGGLQPQTAARLPHRSGRVADRMAPATDADVPWVPFLLTGDDARYAPALLGAMQRSVDEPALDRLRTEHGSEPAYRDEAQVWSLESLTGRSDVGDRLARWLADPQSGQPRLDLEDDADEELIRIGRRMAFLLKLADRFTAQAASITSVRVVEFTADGAREVAPDANQTGAPIDLEALYRRLTDPDAEPWATIDEDGRLLLWRDRAALERVFRDPRLRYEGLWRDGERVLVCRTHAGETFEARLEPPAKDDPAERPIVNVRRLASKPSDGADASESDQAPAVAPEGDDAPADSIDDAPPPASERPGAI